LIAIDQALFEQVAGISGLTVELIVKRPGALRGLRGV
jgi:hypothetical protein